MAASRWGRGREPRWGKGRLVGRWCLSGWLARGRNRHGPPRPAGRERPPRVHPLPRGAGRGRGEDRTGGAFGRVGGCCHLPPRDAVSGDHRGRSLPFHPPPPGPVFLGRVPGPGLGLQPAKAGGCEASSCDVTVPRSAPDTGDFQPAGPPPPHGNAGGGDAVPERPLGGSF